MKVCLLMPRIYFCVNFKIKYGQTGKISRDLKSHEIGNRDINYTNVFYGLYDGY